MQHFKLVLYPKLVFSTFSVRTEFFKFVPMAEGTRQSILADFAMPFFKPPKLLNFFGGPNLNLFGQLKEGTHQGLMADFAAIFPSNNCSLGLE